MEFNSKKFFEKFLRNNLKPDNAEKIHDLFWHLEKSEKVLFAKRKSISGIVGGCKSGNNSNNQD